MTEDKFEIVTKLIKYPENNLGYHYHIMIDDHIAEACYHNNARRVQLYASDSGPVPAAIMKAKDYYYILFSKALMKKFGVIENQSFSLTIVADNSELGVPLPEVFTAVFEIDDEAKKYFNDLTPGKQRTLIHMIDKIKSDHLKTEKTLILMEHLKVNRGGLDYRMLNEAFRNRT